jgi:Domain of unknown function (DUF6766)
VSTLTPTGQRRAAGESPRSGTKHSFWRDHSLAIVCFALFLVMLAGLVATGFDTYNQDQVAHGGSAVGFFDYLREGDVWEAIFENWESEFLQMASFILLTVYLIQRGSAESKDPNEHAAVDDDPRDADLRRPVPWPVRRGGIWLLLYENSLLLAFVMLFVASLIGHALGGVDAHNAELQEHGQPTLSLWGYVSSSQFWFESFQNWQSEFLAVFAIVVLTIFLRERGSPESKPVAAAHSDTGSS